MDGCAAGLTMRMWWCRGRVGARYKGTPSDGSQVPSLSAVCIEVMQTPLRPPEMQRSETSGGKS
jgi:hypothetical protein